MFSLRSSWKRLSGACRKVSHKPWHQRAVLSIESLEDRAMPALFTPLAATADGAAGSLRDNIITANSNGEDDIFLLGAGTYEFTLPNTTGQENAAAKGDLDIVSDYAGGQTITIIGQGIGVTTIDANGIDRIFHVIGGNVTLILQNLSLVGGVARDDGTGGVAAGTTDALGGAILDDGDILTLNGVQIIGNSASGGGGATPGAGGFDAVGGGIFFQSTFAGTSLSIVASQITNNIALAGNGAAGANATTGADAGTSGPGGAAVGGGVFAGGAGGGSALITASTFTNNIAQGGAGGHGGNGIDNAVATRRDGSGGGQGGAASGGALFLAGFGSAGINGTQFITNGALGGLGGDGGNGAASTLGTGGAGSGGGSGGRASGGALYFSGGSNVSVDLATVTLTANKASGGGGGSGGLGGGGVGGAGAGDNGAVGGAALGGGAYIALGATTQTTISDGTVISNRASGGAGGAGGAGGNATTAGLGGIGGAGGTGAGTQGGGLYIDSDDLTIIRTNLSNNTSVGGAGGGGGDGGDSTAAGAGAIGGTAAGGGFAIGAGLQAVANRLDISRSTVNNNDATAGDGGNGGSGGNGGATAGVGGVGGLGGIGGSAFGAGINQATGTLFKITDSTVSRNDANAGSGGSGGDGGDGGAGGIGGAGQKGGSGGDSSGGGLYLVFAGNAQIIQSTISTNSTTGGEGGTGGSGGSGTTTGAGGAGNNAGASNGGGIFVGANGGLVNLDAFNSTIAFNAANGGFAGAGGAGAPIGTPGTASAGVGGGIFSNDQDGNDADDIYLESTILAKNIATGSGTDLQGDVDLNHSLIGVDDAGAAIDSITSSITNLDPLLNTLQNNGGATETHTLKPLSPAINTGTNSLGLAFDQRGTPFVRTFGNGPDIGTVETVGSISGRVFQEFVGDGIQNLGELGLAGRRVFLDLDSNGVLNGSEPSTLTDSSGNYSFANLAPGSYKVRADGQFANVAFGASGAVQTIVVANDVTGVNFGLVVFNTAVPVFPIADNYTPHPHANANVAFVRGLYHQVLGRDADTGGLNSHVNFLAGGGSRNLVVQALVNSLEHRTQQVDFYYRTFLNRPANDPGSFFWVNLLMNTQNETNVIAGIMSSNEYTATHVSNAVFASDLYVRLFGRAADTGVAGWEALLNSGVSRAVVVNSFLRSQESAALAVDSFFAAYLHRPGDANGRAAWLNALASGMTFSQVVVGFLGSTENQMLATLAVP